MPLLASAALLALTGTAYAQSTADLEYRALRLKKKQETAVEVTGRFEAEGYTSNNMDLRVLDTSSDQAIQDSDDRSTFAFGGAAIEVGVKPQDETRFVAALSHRGKWGDDAIGQVNAFGSAFYFTNLFGEYRSGDTVLVRVGREYWELGGIGGAKDYVLADVVDQVRVRFDFGDAAHVSLVPIQVLGNASRDDRANFVSFVGGAAPEYEDLYNFDGDRMVRRHGALLSLDAVEDLDVRAYAFYTDIGARGTGADITYEGRLGNFADNDWVANYGLRASYDASGFVPYVTVDLSQGIDRKELVARDVDNNGVAFSVGLRLRPDDDDGQNDDKGGPMADLTVFHASGPSYAADGLMTSHGYTSMKARQVGGLIADRFMGWHPTAYSGTHGVADVPHTIDRRSGTQFVHAAFGWRTEGGLSVMGSWWTLKDSGATDLKVADLDSIDPPFGYSRREFAAEERLGKLLGHEANLFVGYRVAKGLQVTGNGGVFLPGEFYSIPVTRVAGGFEGANTSLGGDSPAWAAGVGTRMSF